MELKRILINQMGFAGDTLKKERMVVTGGVMGIGRQTASGLARVGAKVAIFDQDAKQAGYWSQLEI